MTDRMRSSSLETYGPPDSIASDVLPGSQGQLAVDAFTACPAGALEFVSAAAPDQQRFAAGDFEHHSSLQPVEARRSSSGMAPIGVAPCNDGRRVRCCLVPLSGSSTDSRTPFLAQLCASIGPTARLAATSFVPQQDLLTRLLGDPLPERVCAPSTNRRLTAPGVRPPHQPPRRSASDSAPARRSAMRWRCSSPVESTGPERVPRGGTVAATWTCTCGTDW